MPRAKPCRYCGHNKTGHRWDDGVQNCRADGCRCDHYAPPRIYETCDTCGLTLTLRHYCQLSAQLKAFARDCVYHGDMTPAGERMLLKILGGVPHA